MQRIISILLFGRNPLPTMTIFEIERMIFGESKEQREARLLGQPWH